jgi:hypothetical protein
MAITRNYPTNDYNNGLGLGDLARDYVRRGKEYIGGAKRKGLDAFTRGLESARGAGYGGEGTEDDPYIMSDRVGDLANRAKGRVSSWRNRAKREGLERFSSGWNKARGLFERGEDEPEEDVTKLTETQLNMRKEEEKKRNYDIRKIEEKYDAKIKYEDDPLEKRRLEMEKEAKIRQIMGKGLSAAEKFMMGKGGEFMEGLKSTSDRDVINPNYKTYDIDSSGEEISRARAYNKKLQRLSERWSKPAAGVGKGLGAFAAASMGGIPGVIAGTAISKGLPMAADWLMSRSAKKHEEEDASERKYNPMRL